jgi:hypothetical protein
LLPCTQDKPKAKAIFAVPQPTKPETQPETPVVSSLACSVAETQPESPVVSSLACSVAETTKPEAPVVSSLACAVVETEATEPSVVLVDKQSEVEEKHIEVEDDFNPFYFSGEDFQPSVDEDGNPEYNDEDEGEPVPKSNMFLALILESFFSSINKPELKSSAFIVSHQVFLLKVIYFYFTLAFGYSLV